MRRIVFGLAAAIWLVLATGVDAQQQTGVTTVTPDEVAAWLGKQREAVTAELREDIEGYLAEDKSALHVVWCLDRSESMLKDLKGLFEGIRGVYDAIQTANRSTRRTLYSSCIAFAKDAQIIVDGAQSFDAVNQAVYQLTPDASGEENPYEAILAALRLPQRGKTVVVVISDETGGLQNRQRYLDPVIAQAKQSKAIITVIGPMAMLGQKYGPSTIQNYVIHLDRGPESPGPELLFSVGGFETNFPVISGYGPYEYERLSRETGGNFYLFPLSDQAELRMSQSYDPVLLTRYQPDYAPFADYVRRRAMSPLRAALGAVCTQFVPPDDEKQAEQVLVSRFKGSQAVQSQAESARRVRIAAQVQTSAARAYQLLTSAEAKRHQEKSLRWLASFDLTKAELLASQLFAQSVMKQEAPQVPGLGYPQAEIQRLRAEVDKAFADVIRKYPGTPYARRAELHAEKVAKVGL